MKGKIICINKYIHRVLLENNTIIDTRTRGKLRNQKVSPVVGDNVIVDINNKTIEKVEPRKNYLERPLIANIDKLLIVMSTSIPVFSDYLIDKFLLIANYNNIEPIIIITKTDMITIKEKAEVRKYMNYYRKLGIKVYINTSIAKIKKEFKNSTVALCGQTGSGKSSLLNKVDASLKLKTGEVSLSLGRGKHTTRLVELLEVNDGLIADTPGFSSLTLDDIDESELKEYFIEFDKHDDCRFGSRCIHENEPSCAVKEAVENGEISKKRYESYIQLLNEIRSGKRRY